MAPFQRPGRLVFPTGGIDTNSPLDGPKDRNKAYRLRNLTIDSDGSLTNRPGISNLYGGVVPISLNHTPCHSARKLDFTLKSDVVNPLINKTGIFYGVGSVLATDYGGIQDISTGFSGRPLTMIPWRPNEAISPYLYVYDSSKLVKVGLGTGITQQGNPINVPIVKGIGIPMPLTVPTPELNYRAWAKPVSTESLAAWTVDTPATNVASALATVNRVNTTVTRFIPDNILVPGASLASYVPADLTNVGPGMFLHLSVVIGGLTYIEDVLVTEVYRGSNANTVAKIGALVLESSSAGGIAPYMYTIQPDVMVHEIARNAIVQINGEVSGVATEYVRIVEMNLGPDSASFRVQTQFAHVKGDSIVILPSFRAGSILGSGPNQISWLGATATAVGIQAVISGPGGVAGTPPASPVGWLTSAIINADMTQWGVVGQGGPTGRPPGRRGNGPSNVVTPGSPNPSVHSGRRPGTGRPFPGQPPSVPPHVGTTATYSSENYFHAGMFCSDWSAVVMVRIMFDVDDGTFTRNFFYWAIQQSVLVAAANGSATPSDVRRSIFNGSGAMGTITAAKQRAIDSGSLGAGGGIGSNVVLGGLGNDTGFVLRTPAGVFGIGGLPNSQLQQLGPELRSPILSSSSGTGANQWSDIRWKRGQMFRVGSDLSKDWHKVIKIRVEVTLTDTTVLPVIAFNSINVFGDGAADIGEIGLPYQYRYRGRDSATGAVGGYSAPSRTDVLAARDTVTVWMDGIINADCDKLDVERFGGQQAGWCYIGSVDNPGNGFAIFTDNTDDASAMQNILVSDRSVSQPWVHETGGPYHGKVIIGAGTALVVDTDAAIPDTTLPGTLITVGGTPTSIRRVISTTRTQNGTKYQGIELNDSIGITTGLTVELPTLRQMAQPIGRVFGPYANCLIACDGIYIRWTEGNDPDATHEENFLEVTDSTDVTVVGFVYNGRAGVLTTKRLLSLSGDPVNGFVATEVPFGKGCYTPYSLALGPAIAWIAKDGIYESQGDIPQNITTADLAPIFPLEGKLGRDTDGVFAPDLTNLTNLRLSYLDDGSLVFSYLGASDQQYHHLRYLHDQKRWFPYDYAQPVNAFYALEGDSTKGVLALGANVTSAKVYLVDGNAGDNTDDGVGFACELQPFFNDFGDPRSRKYVGDMVFEVDTDGLVGGITALLKTDNQTGSVAMGIINGLPGRKQYLFDLTAGDGVRARNIAPNLTWTTESGKRQRLYLWEPSLLMRPETIDLRATDYEVGPHPGDKYMQAITITADTFGVDKVFQIQYDGGQVGATLTINHNGMRMETYSFPVPFTARLLRLATADTDGWEVYAYEYKWNPEPPAALHWQIQFTGFDIPGFKHMPEMRLAIAAAADVTMTLYADDDVTPYYPNVVVPNTGGSGYGKMRRGTPIILPARKFKLWSASFDSPTPFRMYMRDIEVLVKGWGADGDYSILRPFGDIHRTDGAKA